MLEALRPLEEKSRLKRQTENQGDQEQLGLSDEMSDEAIENTKIEVDSISNTIGMPLGKKGNPAFSIHAKTVYILYPSLFQDPNIFGRFSIPQNINMDKNVLGNEKTNPSGKPEVLIAPPQPPSIPPQNRIPTQMPQQVHPNYPSRKGRRSADASPPATQPPKRNVETHLAGTIVVQNQDVNEYNRRESY